MVDQRAWRAAHDLVRAECARAVADHEHEVEGLMLLRWRQSRGRRAVKVAQTLLPVFRGARHAPHARQQLLQQAAIGHGILDDKHARAGRNRRGQRPSGGRGARGRTDRDRQGRLGEGLAGVDERTGLVYGSRGACCGRLCGAGG